VATRWLLFAILVTPVVAVPGGWGVDLFQARNAAFILLGLSVVVGLVADGWLRAFLGWTVVSFLWAGARPWALLGLLGVLAWALCYFLAARVSAREWPRVRVVLALAALFQIGWLVVQALGRDPLFVPLRTQGGILPDAVPLSGWFGNPMDLALYLGLALPLLVAVHPVFLLIVGVALCALKVTAGFVGLAVSGLWLLRRRPWWALGFLGLIVTGVLVLDPQGAGLRPLIWKQAVQVAALRPVLGWGPNAVDYRIIIETPAQAVRWNFIFNEYLQGWLELGGVGVFLAGGFLASLFWRLRSRWSEAGELVPALVILLVVASFSIPFRSGPAALVTAVILGQLERRLA
jgi:hypothetical protein